MLCRKRSKIRCLISRTLAVLLLAGWTSLCSASGTNGFLVKFTGGDGRTTDHLVMPNLWLYVGVGEAPAPFVPPGPFTAEFTGFIHAELRGTYLLKAERLSGSIRIEINGTNVLVAEGAGASAMSGVQLNKGANPVKALFKSARGDSYVRIGWTERGTNVNPIPDAWISHAPTAELAVSRSLHQGRALFLEHRCVRCHAAPDRIGAIPELAMDAPAFEDIGRREEAAWMAAWMQHPKQMRPSAWMPRVLKGATAAEDARAIAAYLSTLREPKVSPAVVPAQYHNPAAEAEIDQRSGPAAKPTLAGDDSEPSEQTGTRQSLFQRLHCTACHNAPDTKETDPAKISLKHVRAKFQSGQLAAFLRRPDQHYGWTRMPDFRLAEEEVQDLAEFLLKHADAVPVKEQKESVEAPASMVERGRTLLQTTGCLNCHSAGNLENRYAAPSLAQLSKWDKGCLAEKPASNSAPDFGFDPKSRLAVAEFLSKGGRDRLIHAPLEFATRQTQALQCNGCHGKIDLVPPLEVLGGKLKPEWTADFLRGHPNKVRADMHPKGGDWVLARMPSFRARAQWLAEGMAVQHGYGPRSAEEPPVDEAAAAIGYKLVGKESGLSCISCHGVNGLPALEVFESEGPNLGLTGSRLMRSYFFRWMRNPLSVDPQSKMPAFFSEDGQSALTEYYEGDGEKQIEALYEYMRLGGKMQKPGGAP